MLPPTFDARLLRARQLTRNVRELVFERKDGAPFDFEPGQWVSLVLDTSEGELRRAYSIASAPAGAVPFELIVTLVDDGLASKMLHEMQPGQEVRVIGPQGFFVREDPRKAALFVATGTGVAPFRSMIRAEMAKGELAPTWLLFGGRTFADVLYEEEMQDIARTTPSFRFFPTLSRGDEVWTGRRGYVQAHAAELFAELSKDGSSPDVFICGVERMVGAVRALFRKELGLPRQRVHSERYD